MEAVQNQIVRDSMIHLYFSYLYFQSYPFNTLPDFQCLWLLYLIHPSVDFQSFLINLLIPLYNGNLLCSPGADDMLAEITFNYHQYIEEHTLLLKRHKPISLC